MVSWITSIAYCDPALAAVVLLSSGREHLCDQVGRADQPRIGHAAQAARQDDDHIRLRRVQLIKLDIERRDEDAPAAPFRQRFQEVGDLQNDILMPWRRRWHVDDLSIDELCRLSRLRQREVFDGADTVSHLVSHACDPSSCDASIIHICARVVYNAASGCAVRIARNRISSAHP